MKNTFWDRTAKIYDRFMRKDHKAYKQMCAMILPWSSADYLAFLQSNDWIVHKSAVLKASFPLTYAECVKKES